MTPVINATTTYYVDAIGEGCPASSRTPVIATVFTIPEIISINSVNSNCQNQEGEININAKGNDTLEYSLNGVGWSVQAIFKNLVSGQYKVEIRNKNDENCLTDSLVNVEMLCADTTHINLCNTVGVYDLFNAITVTDKSKTWTKDILNISTQLPDSTYNFLPLDSGNYQFSYWSDWPLKTLRKIVIVKLTDQKSSGVPVPATTQCNPVYNLFFSISNYNEGGVWTNNDKTSKVADSVATLQPGTNHFTYTIPAKGGCSADSTSVIIYVDSVPPQINCYPELKEYPDFVAPYYIANDSLNPISVKDNCNYTLKNSINNDTTLAGVHINNSTVVKWTATDISGNSSTCEINVILKIGRIPNTISPNGDYINDVWEFKLSEYYPDAVVQIYNRWGQLIWVSEKGYDTNGNYWNGYDSHGDKVPVDSYEYLISNDGIIIAKGFISVIY
jgi:gliding motility-associated-like protein